MLLSGINHFKEAKAIKIAVTKAKAEFIKKNSK